MGELTYFLQSFLNLASVSELKKKKKKQQSKQKEDTGRMQSETQGTQL